MFEWRGLGASGTSKQTMRLGWDESLLGLFFSCVYHKNLLSSPVPTKKWDEKSSTIMYLKASRLRVWSFAFCVSVEFWIIKMRTSVTQFEMMVTFMEQHGDLTKPTGNVRGRLQTLNHWEELTTLLNSDPSGDSKTGDKWRKVWSDLKNNTKKKAARINRAAKGTGGGPALTTKLTDLEQRVLNLVGTQAATGMLGVAESGVFQEEPVGSINYPPHETPSQNEPQSQNEPPPVSNTPLPPASPQTYGELNEIAAEEWNQPGPSSRPHYAPAAVNPLQNPPIPASEGQTTPTRPRSQRPRRSPRRRTRPTSSVDRVSQEFHNSDSEWRKFLIEKERREDEYRQEQLRLRSIELALQEQWQQIINKALDILENKL